MQDIWRRSNPQVEEQHMVMIMMMMTIMIFLVRVSCAYSCRDNMFWEWDTFKRLTDKYKELEC